MNAIKFIKDHGVDKAREVVEGAPEWATHFNIQVGYTKASNGGEYTFYKNKRTGDEEYSLHYEMGIDLYDLKRLVESVDLIKKHGGLFSTKCQLDKGGSHHEWYGENGDYGLTDLEDLEQAIADYESIGGEHV